MKRLSKITSAFLLFIMLLGIMKNNVLHTLYKYDRGLFISLFCENKAFPQLNCNGKCKLGKMEKEQKEDAANMLQHLQTEALSYNKVNQIQFNCYESVPGNIGHRTYYSATYSFLYTRSFVKPPDFA